MTVTGLHTGMSVRETLVMVVRLVNVATLEKVIWVSIRIVLYTLKGQTKEVTDI
jgi:hypothetical protein